MRSIRKHVKISQDTEIMYAAHEIYTVKTMSVHTEVQST